MEATYSPVGLKSSPVITSSKEYIVNSTYQLRLMLTVLGVPFRLADKLDNIFGLGGIRANVEEMVRNVSIERNSPKDTST